MTFSLTSIVVHSELFLFQRETGSIYISSRHLVSVCCTPLLWTQWAPKHMVCLNWDSISTSTRAITTSGLAAAIVNFRNKTMSVGYKKAALERLNAV